MAFLAAADTAFADSFLVTAIEHWLDPTQCFRDRKVVLIASVQSTVSKATDHLQICGNVFAVQYKV